MTRPQNKISSAKRTSSDRFHAVVIGASAGGLQTISTLLPVLPKEFPLPILIAQHRLPSSDDFLAKALDQLSPLCVKEAEDKEPLRPGFAYIAPANYHLLVERDETLCLSVDPKVNWSRPSIDVLFESAAAVWGAGVISVILTGANDDGARGTAFIKQNGGLTIAQDPATAEHPTMPQAAIDTTAVDHILPASEIGVFLKNLALNHT